jgi:hypothetical protein
VNSYWRSRSIYHYDRYVAEESSPTKVSKLRLTARGAQARVHEISQDSGNLIWTTHISEQMEARGIDADAVLRILRRGEVDDDPVEGTNSGEWKLKITHKLTGGRVAGVVTVIVADKKLILITAEWEDFR